MRPVFHRFGSSGAATVVVAALFLSCWGATPAAEKLAVRTYSASDGLGSSFISHVFQDTAGHVWFATRDGLSRWNGYAFTTYAQDAGFSTPAIGMALQTRSGQYYVVDIEGALYACDPAPSRLGSHRGAVTFERRAVRFNGGDLKFTRLYEDRHGVLWGGGQGALVRGVGGDDVVIPLPPPSSAAGALVIVEALLEGEDGRFWIGTNRGLYRLLDDGRTARYSFTGRPGLELIPALVADPRGGLWVGHGSLGVLAFNPGADGNSPVERHVDVVEAGAGALPIAPRGGQAVLFDRRHGLPDNKVLTLLGGTGGHLWVGTAAGLARIDGKTVVSYTKANGLLDGLIHGLAEDGDGNLWVATPTGAMHVLLDGLSAYTSDEGLGEEHIVGIGETSSRAVFGIGIDWSVSLFDGRQFRTSRMPVPPGSSAMWASQVAYRDRAGRWWALTNDGLYRFDAQAPDGVPSHWGTARRYGIREGLPNPHVFRVYEDRTGVMWIGTRSGDPVDDGLATLSPDLSRATSFGRTDGLPARAAPSAFAEVARGDLWVGFYSGGVARFRAGRFRTFTEADGIPPGMVTALLADATGRLWIATNTSGLARIDEPSSDTLHVQRYGTREGLSSNNVRALTEDRQGRIFAGSVRGVDRLDPATGRVRHYGRTEGLANDYVTAAYCDARGGLWFGSYAGIFHLRDAPEAPDDPPPVAVTGLRVAGDRFPVLELGQVTVGPLLLDPEQRDIGIDFLSVSRRGTAGVLYQYTIDGGGTWSLPSPERTVNFARLPPGLYQFAVRAVTANRTVSRVPATVVFTIRPPVWRRWWARTAMAVVLAGFLLGLHRYRVRRLVEVERLRTAIAADLHDEVATNLSSIATFATLVRGGLETPSPLLDRITVLATESVDAIREIIWSVDPKPETVASLLLRLHDALATSCRSRGIHLAVDAPSEQFGGNLTAAQRKHLWLLLKEAVSNACRHSNATTVRVTASRAGRRVRFTVADNGTGFAPGAGSTGRGLTTMQSRAASLGGALTIAAGAEGGTTVQFVTDRLD